MYRMYSPLIWRSEVH